MSFKKNSEVWLNAIDYTDPNVADHIRACYLEIDRLTQELSQRDGGWQPIETAPRSTEIQIALWDGVRWNQEVSWVEDWEPDYSPENMRWQPLPKPPLTETDKEESK